MLQLADRYSLSRDVPSRLNACFTCDAMGCLPPTTPDGDFTQCPDCRGTKRLPLSKRGVIVAASRLP